MGFLHWGTMQCFGFSEQELRADAPLPSLLSPSALVFVVPISHSFSFLLLLPPSPPPLHLYQ